VYSHEVTEDYDDAVIAEAIDGEYDIDIGIDTIQANITNQHPAGSRIPFGRWKSLAYLRRHKKFGIPFPTRTRLLSSDLERVILGCILAVRALVHSFMV
jgi:hypothetical protein